MKILIADDDRDLVDWLGYSFRRDGYSVVPAYDGEAALRAFSVESPDVLVLDVKMPKLGGLEVLTEIRRRSQIPIVILSAMNDEESTVKALKLGADDFVVKPFRPRELRARVAAMVRRSQGKREPASKTATPVACGDLEIDPRSRTVTVGGQPARLTRHEFEVLEYLVLNHGSVTRVSDILANVWGFDSEGSDEVVRVTISRLRRKIEPDPSHPRYIINVPGQGYMVPNRD